MKQTPRIRIREVGTTLIEVLVVIVVFLVGILAIAQIFPGGIRILNSARNNSMALALARSSIEHLKSRPDVLPEYILPINMMNTGSVYEPFVEVTRLPSENAPTDIGIDNNGIGVDSGRAWQLVSGPNTFRRIIGETHKITAPRLLSPDPSSATAHFGSLITVEFGPIDHMNGAPVNASQLLVYGRDMYRRFVKDTPGDYQSLKEYEYAIEAINTPDATFVLPATIAGTFRMNFTVTVNNGGTVYQKRITGAIGSIAVDPSGYSFVRVDSIAGVLTGSETLVTAEVEGMQVARVYRQLAIADAFDPNEPFTYKLLNGRIGQLLFNPTLFGRYEERSGASRQPYVARLDYDVRDWRILHEDVRVSQSLPTWTPKVMKLSVPSLKTNSVAGPDGKRPPTHAQVLSGQDAPNAGMEDVYVVSNNDVANANTDVADNMLVIDVETGGQLLESYNGQPAIRVDKSNGAVVLLDADNDQTNGLTGAIATLDGSVVLTTLTSRVLRFYYMGRLEWAVQVTRNAAKYSSTIGAPGAGQFYVGGTGALNGTATRVYFPRMDTNRKISISKIRYMYDNGGGPTQGTLEGAEFQIRNRTGADTIGAPMPSIDLRDIDPNAIGFVQPGGPESTPFSITDVRGISIVVRVFYNSEKFSLDNNPANNLNVAFGNWAKTWNVTAKETYLHRGDALK